MLSNDEDSFPSTSLQRISEDSPYSSDVEEIAIDEELDNYCSQIKDIFHTVRNKSRRFLQQMVNGQDSSEEKLYIIYEELNTKNALEDFWGECALRLQSIFKHQGKDTLEAELLLTFFTLFAVRTLLQKYNPEIINFFAERCRIWSLNRDIYARMNCCLCVGYFFQYFPGIFGDPDDFPIEIRSDVRGLRYSFYVMLIRLVNDQCSQIRSKICTAIEPIQNEPISSTFEAALTCSPKDCILHFLSDKSSIVRKAAVQAITFTVEEKNYAPALVAIAAEEADINIRMITLSKIANIGPLSYTIEDRELLFYNNLTLDDELAEYLKKKVIGIWLAEIAAQLEENMEIDEPPDAIKRKCLPGAVHYLIGEADWINHGKEVLTICFAVYDVVRHIINRGKIVTLPEMVKMLIEDVGPIVIISRFNRDILFKNDLTQKQIAAHTFFWRALIQFCYDMTSIPDCPSRDRNYEAERDACLQKLAPSLKEMCDFIMKLKSEFFHSGAEELQFIEIAIVNCLHICSCLDPDPCGVKAWRTLLENLLLDPLFSQETLCYISTTLMTTHYVGDEQALLSHVLDHFADLTHHETEAADSDSDIMIIEEKVRAVPLLPSFDDSFSDDGSLAGSFRKVIHLFSSPPRTQQIKEEPMIKETPHLNLHQIKVINAVLRTGAFKTINPYLKQLNETLIPRCISSKNDEMTANGLNAFTALSMINNNKSTLIEESAMLLFTAAKKFKNLPKSRIGAMYNFVDIAIVFEKSVRQWMEDNDFNYTEIFSCLVEEKSNEELVFTAAEAASKLLVCSPKDSNDEAYIAVLSALLARCYHSSIDELPKVKSCIFQCINVLNLRGRSQLQLLPNALLYLLDDMYRNGDDPFYKKVNVSKAAAAVVEVCRDYPADDNNRLSMHNELMEAVMEMLSRVIENDRFVRFYCEIGCLLDIYDIQRDDLIRYVNQAHRLVDEIGRKLDINIDIQIDELDKLLTRLKGRKVQLEEIRKKAASARRRNIKRKVDDELELFGTTPRSSVDTPSRPSRLPRSTKGVSPGFYAEMMLPSS